MNEKAVGYVLLLIGILAIVFAGINVCQVFTGRIKPVDLVGYTNLPLSISQDGLSQEVSVPIDLLNEPVNLIAHIFLMGFVVNISYKIASLGTMMARPIKVNLKGGDSKWQERNIT